MALSTKDIYNLLKEFNEYGAAIYYALEKEEIQLDDITNVLFKDSIEKVNLVFPKFIERLSVEDIEKSKVVYQQEFSRLTCIDRIIEKDQDRHQHLREIRDIVHLEKDLGKMIKERNFQTAFNLYFTGKILDRIASCEKKGHLSIREMVKLYQTAHALLQEETDKKISSNIDSYYISMITN